MDWVAEKAKHVFFTALQVEVQDQGVGRVGFFRGPSPWLVDGHLFPLSSRGFPSMYVCVLNSFKDSSLSGLGATLIILV